jgi:hypothetical protein
LKRSDLFVKICLGGIAPDMQLLEEMAYLSRVHRSEDVMKENPNTNLLVPKELERVPQLQVRTNVRGGESVDACMTNLDYWKKEYYKWYDQAKYKLG